MTNMSTSALKKFMQCLLLISRLAAYMFCLETADPETAFQNVE